MWLAWQTCLPNNLEVGFKFKILEYLKTQVRTGRTSPLTLLPALSTLASITMYRLQHRQVQTPFTSSLKSFQTVLGSGALWEGSPRCQAYRAGPQGSEGGTWTLWLVQKDCTGAQRFEDIAAKFFMMKYPGHGPLLVFKILSVPFLVQLKNNYFFPFHF